MRPDFRLAPLTFPAELSGLSALVDARGLLRTAPPRDQLDVNAFFLSAATSGTKGRGRAAASKGKTKKAAKGLLG